ACISDARRGPRRQIGRHVFVEPRHVLFQAGVGAVFLDHTVAHRGRREVAAAGDTRATADVFEDNSLFEVHRFNVVAAAMAVHDALGRHDLFKAYAVLIIASVGAVHDEAPHGALAEIETVRGRGEAVRSPPLRQMLGVGKGRKDQIARRIEFAHADDRARIAVEIEATSYGHVYSLFYGP